MKYLTSFVVVVAFVLPACAAAQPSPAAAAATRPTTTAKANATPSPYIRPAAKPGERPVEQIKRVMVVSIDGLRPDLLLRANAPAVRALMARGCYTMWARTTPNSITLPSHVSMMTGVTPRRHEVEWNRELELIEPLYPRVPTLFEAAKRHGYTTALASGKDKFDIFDRPGALDWRSIPAKGTTETADVIEAAVEIIREHRPDVMLVHFPSVDKVGHAIGWATPEQVKAIEDADAAVGRLVALLDEMKLADSTLLIVTADHGGAGRSHGPDDPRSRHIPWVAVGPGIRRGVDLTIYPKLTVNTEDTFATSCWALGIPPTVADLDGVPVKIILEPVGGELMHPTTGPAKPPASW